MKILILFLINLVSKRSREEILMDVIGDMPQNCRRIFLDRVLAKYLKGFHIHANGPKRPRDPFKVPTVSGNDL